MKHSIIDISKMAGCSTATVSRVLNNIGQISKETRASVMKAVEAVNYVPRGSHARKSKSVSSMNSGKGVRIIELVFCFREIMEYLSLGDYSLSVRKSDPLANSSEMDNQLRHGSSFYRMLSEGVMDEARRCGFKTIVRCIKKENLNNLDFISSLHDDKISGLILSGVHTEALSGFISSCKIPMVLADQMAGAGPVEITTDNLEGISLAFDHIYSLGHRKIGFIRGDDNPAYHERYVSFVYKMAEKLLRVRKEWIYYGENHVLPTAEWCSKILKGPERPTAFICSNDYGALGVIRAASDAGIRMPSQLSVIGFDDIETSALVTPPLTTIRVPQYEIGRRAVKELLITLGNGNSEPGFQCRMRLSPKLVIRESTAKQPLQARTGKISKKNAKPEN
jgi:DNA-binding LacI/PurR family transcriptional regulator